MINFKPDDYKDALISDIKKLVDIPSVLDPNADTTPFGHAISEALKAVCAIAESIGFVTYVEPEGYYAYADIGKGEKLVGVLGHLDVVPAEDVENWNTPPFDATIVDNCLYGRGTQDDKGPIVACLYAVKYLIDQGYTFEQRLRFIFGTDEENLWRGIKKYMAKEEKPDYGFTPDSIFPLIYAEKGLLQCFLKGPNTSPLRFEAGGALNAVPDKASLTSKFADPIEAYLVKSKFEYSRSGDTLTSIGKAAHAAHPDLGVNAINHLALAINQCVNSDAIRFIADEIGLTFSAEHIIGEFQDVSGGFTLNVGTVCFTEDTVEIGIDVRMPVTYKKEDFVARLIERAQAHHLTYEEFDYLAAIYIPIENHLIKRLRAVYEDCTGLDSTPLISGGATYARSMDNCVAFGAVLPGTPKTEHQANENINLDDLIKSTEIYINAIYALTRKEGAENEKI